MDEMTTVDKLSTVFDGMKTLVLEKNRRYGDSALCPLKVFSRIDSSEGIRIRLDDKLSRVKNSNVLRKNDCADLIGYLVLLCASEGWMDFDDLLD